MKCKICDVEYEGNGITCSGACRAKLSRRNKDIQSLGKAHAEILERTRTEAHAPKRTRTEGCQVSLPGDEDYTGACIKIDGAWKVDKTPDTRPLTSLTRRELASKIKAYPNCQWIGTEPHKELLRRLRTWSIDKLEELGYFVPAWKRAS